MAGFNDFLFDQLYKKPYIHDAYNSEDEALDHFMSGEVTVPFNDIARLWTQYTKQLPSQFQIGDLVTLNFGSAGKVTGADIIKVHFSESKVLYDVDILMSDAAEGKVITRIYNIDSCFVEPAE